MFGNPAELLGSLGPVSIIVLLALLGFSVISWAIIIFKWRMFRETDEMEQRFLGACESYVRMGEYKKLESVARESPDGPRSLVFLGLLKKVDPAGNLLGDRVGGSSSRDSRWPDRHYLEKVVQFTIQEQVNRLEAYLPFLATTGNITPFVGLLGTVLGIINAFKEIGVQGSASIASVAPGVAEALVATAAGLFAAIPAVIAYNYFLIKIRRTVFRVEAFSIELLNTFDELGRETKEPKEVEVVR